MNAKYPLAVLAAAFVLAGCDRSKQSDRSESSDISTPPAQEQREVTQTEPAVPPEPMPAPAPEQREIVKQEPAEPADTTKPYPAENRDEFVVAMREKLTELDQQINDLGDTIATLNDNEFAEETLNSLREQRSQLDPLFEELSTSSEEAWDDAKKSFESALAELEQAYQAAKETYGA